MNIFKKLKQWREKKKEFKLFMNAAQECFELGGDTYEMSAPVDYIGDKIFDMFINVKTFVNDKCEKYVITEINKCDDEVYDLTFKKINNKED